MANFVLIPGAGGVSCGHRVVKMLHDRRFFPADIQARVAKARVDVAGEALAGGHLVAVSDPGERVARLASYVRSVGA